MIYFDNRLFIIPGIYTDALNADLRAVEFSHVYITGTSIGVRDCVDFQILGWQSV